MDWTLFLFHIQDNEGQTALYIAILCEREDNSELLVKHRPILRPVGHVRHRLYVASLNMLLLELILLHDTLHFLGTMEVMHFLYKILLIISYYLCGLTFLNIFEWYQFSVRPDIDFVKYMRGNLTRYCFSYYYSFVEFFVFTEKIENRTTNVRTNK